MEVPYLLVWGRPQDYCFLPQLITFIPAFYRIIMDHTDVIPARTHSGKEKEVSIQKNWISDRTVIYKFYEKV
jgi:hypothetical protein